ncbi:MAG: ABC transporter ATP-binding protein [bacterium]
MIAVETLQLTKIFGRKKITALSEVSIAVESGIIFGLLGPNGAGKTTLIKILLGILFPTNGSARIMGHPLHNIKVKEKIGYLPENHKYPDFLKGGEVLDYFAMLSGVGKMRRRRNKKELLKLVDMEKWQHTKLKKYSKGMLQRLALAQAMINDPEILFLDEPTDGVDPIGRKRIRDILWRLREEGKTIFINSHMLSEVERVCDEVAILNKGELLRVGTVHELTTPSKTYRFETSQIANNILDDLGKHTLKLDPRNGFFQVTVADQHSLNAIIDHLRVHEIDIKSILPHKQSLEESFMEILTRDIEA